MQSVINMLDVRTEIRTERIHNSSRAKSFTKKFNKYKHIKISIRKRKTYAQIKPQCSSYITLKARLAEKFSRPKNYIPGKEIRLASVFLANTSFRRRGIKDTPQGMCVLEIKADLKRLYIYIYTWKHDAANNLMCLYHWWC